MILRVEPAAEARPRIERAKARLDRLDWYGEPVRVERVRLVHFPLWFRNPLMRRFSGYTLWRSILFERPLGEVSDDLLTHELCHVWQGQQRRWHMLWTYVTTRYENNPYEHEARRAVAETK